MAANPFQIAALLPRFYEKNALGIGGLNATFRVTSFKFGHDPALIDNATNPPTLTPFDPTDTDIKNVFFTGTFTPANDVVWENGRLLFRCVMPRGTLTEAKQYSQTGIYDQDGDLIAVSIGLPGWISPAEDINTQPFINFPIAVSEVPEE